MTIEEIYQQLCELPSDINEHLPTIKKYACLSDRIVEFGVRGIVSTWALLAGHPKSMVSFDIVDPKEHGGDVKLTAWMAKEEGTDWSFVKASSLEITFTRTDLLFIDTIHSYEQLSAELKRHSPRVTKYIIMHDTNLPEMTKALDEFLTGNFDWKIKEVVDSGTGLTVLQRI